MKKTRTPINFLTGGTGLLGSHIGAELLRRGQKTFFLIRSKDKTSAGERLKKVLTWHGIAHQLRSKAYLVEGDLAALDPLTLRTELPQIHRVIHCASETSFAERHRRSVWRTNVEHLQRLLNFVGRKRIPAFFYISTAYAVGRKAGRCPEEPLESRNFFNGYEESKAEAEAILLERCFKEGIRLTILRPSIVYGHSRTGRTYRFNALYYPIKTALFLKKIFLEDIRQHDGLKAAEAGVYLLPDGRIHLPLRINVGKNGGVNLIPVDFFVKAFFAITEDAFEGGIYHIVNSQQTRIAAIIDYAQEQFGLHGIEACSEQNFQRTAHNSLERLFERYLEAYSPYMKDQRRFTTEKADPILQRNGLRCPPFDAAMCRRCMAFAAQNNWSGLSM